MSRAFDVFVLFLFEKVGFNPRPVQDYMHDDAEEQHPYHPRMDLVSRGREIHQETGHPLADEQNKNDWVYDFEKL
jgi:hypothetical protein